jgi:oligopeptide/dipeptide ABC transporter ATP-binding protein
MSILLDIRDLSVDYQVKGGYLSAVHKVNFHLKRGEIFALVGESGCGKSTIAYSIIKLLNSGNEKVTGEIIFEGTNLQDLKSAEMSALRGKKIGMVFQNPLDSLNPVYTSGWQVQEAIALDKVDRLQAWQKVRELYSDMKIPDPEKRMKSFPHELSGGMRQRVMIAMMLSRNPALLIADEPTTALDVTIEAQILEIIKELRTVYQTSVLLITHNFGLVAEVADRIGVMYAGQLVEEGDVFQIFENPVHPYTRLLLAALPRISKRDGELATISGSVPKLIGEIKGCRFANRCLQAEAICFEQGPVMVEIETGHSCACNSYPAQVMGGNKQ